MNLIIKTSLILFMAIVLLKANIIPLNTIYDELCQSLHCNTSTEICRINPKCDGSKHDLLLKCVYCDLKSKSTIFQQQLPLAPRLLAKSGEKKLNNQNDSSKSNDSSYDEYYEYEDDGTLDKNDLNDMDDYGNDYVEPYHPTMNRSQTIRKSGICPKLLRTIANCDAEKFMQPDCRFDTDCPGELKCCDAECEKRVCKTPIRTKVSLCPTSFQCTLNCPLGYRTDANGCLKCECQSCPSMDQCTKNCPSGYLKDLFGCDVCECNDRCPPFYCSIICPSGVGFAQSENGCPLCQCAIPRSKPMEYTSLCQEDVHCPPGFRCLTDVQNVPMCQAVPTGNDDCDNDFATKCQLQCENGNYLQDDRGCSICACAVSEGQKSISCPKMKCRADCGDGGYQSDQNGCQTCICVKKESVQCSKVMCRMLCQNGFKRDENGCEYCACNEFPQACPLLDCQTTCDNGYRKDYSGCATCECNEQKEIPNNKCLPVQCDLECKYGLQKDSSNCNLCACNRCPLLRCKMYCMYGFRKNEDGCDMCECDWTPIAGNIQCSERIPCPDTRVCNSKLKLCEKVDPDNVNWFLYDFEIKSDLFNDKKFIQTFKNGLTNNIAKRYDLQTTQIHVSSVEQHGLASFQIMPMFGENMEEFQNKMDRIDVDLNSHEFRSVLPAVVNLIDENDQNNPPKTGFGKFCGKVKNTLRASLRTITSVFLCLLIGTGLVFLIIRMNTFRRRFQNSSRSDSKSPIYESGYHQAPTDDEQFHGAHSTDGTPNAATYSYNAKLSKEKQVAV